MSIARRLPLLAVLLLVLVMAGCSTTGNRGLQGGGYYEDDGPGSNPPSSAQLDAIPNAVPRIEPLINGTNKPYVVFGKRYVPDASDQPFRQEGIASWYGRKFNGVRTSSGERYNMYAMTAAHPTLPIPSYARVTSEVNGKTIIVRINDRGPFHSNRIMDLSYTAAYKLGLIGPGSGRVIVQRILPSEIRTMVASGNIAPEDSQLTADQATHPIAPAPQTQAPAPLSPAPLPPQAESSMAAPPAQGAYYLQLGAFSRQYNATTLAHRINTELRGMGKRAQALQIARLYRVRIGPYDTREAATSDIPTVNAKTGIQPSLIRP
ncbi:septal ring lytic transglycosylase RlpA family protein [Bordetella sp. FB-8]|uniref:septal ring lytic transglycosylase RlpA family protein n=1 Tax=Bordetella sp. FB-8 TaxID=1159870 RepID=UPI0003714541|nr:septal ring lytic transglycosylase RlpA family protein [Bordetella sp. FB-8]